MKTVLLIEDDTDLLTLLKHNLENEGYRVVEAYPSRDEQIDLIILDAATPKSDGLDDYRAVQSHPELVQIPLAILVECASKIARFGGKYPTTREYIVKPFFVRDLLSRVASQLHQQAQPAGIMRFGPLELDRLSGRVTVNGIAHSTTATELRLLEFLMSQPGVVYSSEQLLTSVWGRSRSLTAGNVAAFIMGLRKKIEYDPAHPVFIRSVRGFGYSFNETVGNSPGTQSTDKTEPPLLGANTSTEISRH